MKRLIALMVGALVGTGLVIAPAEPAQAGSTTITGDGWTMTVSVADASWNTLFLPNFYPCNELELAVTLIGPAVIPTTEWTLSVDIRPRGSLSATTAFDFPRTGSGTFPITGVRICDDFNAPNAHPEGLYDVTGVARVPKDTPVPSPSALATFTVTKMFSSIMLQGYSNQTGSSVFTGRVSQWQGMVGGGFYRPVTGGAVALDQLASGVWSKIADGMWTGDGWFSASAGATLPIGTYVRVRYLGDFSVAPLETVYEVGAPMPGPLPNTQVPVAPPPAAPAALPVPTMKIKAVSHGSKLKVDVNPDRGSKFYVFQVQRKSADGSWKAVKSYETRGATEKRTLNLRKGTYRVWVRPGYGFAEAYSPNEVTLKR